MARFFQLPNRGEFFHLHASSGSHEVGANKRKHALCSQQNIFSWTTADGILILAATTLVLFSSVLSRPPLSLSLSVGRMEAAAFSSSSSPSVPRLRSSSPSTLLYPRHRSLREKPLFKSKHFSIRASANGDRGELISICFLGFLVFFFVFFPLFAISSFNLVSVVTLLDYGAGNVRSVRNAIRFLGFDIKDVGFPSYLSHYYNNFFLLLLIIWKVWSLLS